MACEGSSEANDNSNRLPPFIFPPPSYEKRNKPILYIASKKMVYSKVLNPDTRDTDFPKNQRGELILIKGGG